MEFTQDANWTTTCTGTQVQGATAPAICGPLVLVKPLPGDAAAGDAAAGDAAGDAAAGDAGVSDAGVSDAGVSDSAAAD